MDGQHRSEPEGRVGHAIPDRKVADRRAFPAAPPETQRVPGA